jgi:hypothetical protein
VWERGGDAQRRATLTLWTLQGYGGADLRALCTEAALHAVRRHYPQIYASDRRLLVDPARIELHAVDFAAAFANLVPAARRATPLAAGRPLPLVVAPLLQAATATVLARVRALLAVDAAAVPSGTGASPGLSEAAEAALAVLLEVSDTDTQAAADAGAASDVRRTVARQLHFDPAPLAAEARAPKRSLLRQVYRPRLAVQAGALGAQAAETVARAALHGANGITVVTLEAVALLTDPSRTPEVGPALVA